MPTMADLGKLATELYKGNPTVGAKQEVEAHLDYSKASALGFTGSYFYVWSGEEYSSYGAYYRYFQQFATGWYNYTYDFHRDISGIQAVCVSE